jgi:hypothetical protein
VVPGKIRLDSNFPGRTSPRGTDCGWASGPGW